MRWLRGLEIIFVLGAAESRGGDYAGTKVVLSRPARLEHK